MYQHHVTMRQSSHRPGSLRNRGDTASLACQLSKLHWKGDRKMLNPNSQRNSREFTRAFRENFAKRQKCVIPINSSTQVAHFLGFGKELKSQKFKTVAVPQRRRNHNKPLKRHGIVPETKPRNLARCGLQGNEVRKYSLKISILRAGTKSAELKNVPCPWLKH